MSIEEQIKVGICSGMGDRATNAGRRSNWEIESDGDSDGDRTEQATTRKSG